MMYPGKSDPLCSTDIQQLTSDTHRNLQRANHVVFVSAYVAATKSEYLARRVQAVGRALRYGQNKDVHVYDFLMARTLEVNIIQDRHDRALVKHDDGTYGLEKRNGSEPTPLEGPNMQGAATGVGALDLTEVEEQVPTYLQVVTIKLIEKKPSCFLFQCWIPQGTQNYFI